MKALLFAALSMLLFSDQAAAQQPYTIRQDPSNPKRKIIDMKPATRQISMINQLTNGLKLAPRRPAIPYDSFRMVHPKTGKALDPNKKMTIKFNDSVSKTMTIKDFYYELNQMEQSLCATGRSLRIPATLSDLRPNFSAAAYSQQAKLGFGFKSTEFKTSSNPAPTYNAKSGKLISSGFTPIKIGVNPGTFKAMEWKPKLYVALRYENAGTTEFPAEWVSQTLISPGRKVFPLIVEAPKGFDGLIKRIDWQVRTEPFDQTLIDINVPGIVYSGSISNTVFSQGVRGVDILPNAKNNTFYYFTIDLSQKLGAPSPTAKSYYIRTIEYSASNEVLKISPQVIVHYGGTAEVIRIPMPEVNSVPGFNYSYPADASVPFGVFVRGEGFSTYENKEFISKTSDAMKTNGFRVKANAMLGLRYFNFLSIVNENEPKSKELYVITARFKAGAGIGIPSQDQGVKMSLDILEGLYKPEIDFAAQVPGASVIPIEHTISQPMDWPLVDTRFFIGPVPFRIRAKIGGDAGIKMSGSVNTASFEFNGSITPYLNTYFTASGGVDAVIAYATLNAEVNPLLGINMPVTFSSSGKALTFNNTISGLNGRVYLAVGFYYPCPSLEKIVGFFTGDEPLPLCECRWEWNIFDWKGFNESFNYESK